MIEQTTCPRCLTKLCEMSLYDDLEGKLSCPECRTRVDRWIVVGSENVVKFNYEDFNLMLNAAWSAFDSTLKAHGATEGQVKELTSMGVAMGLYKTMRNIAHTVIETEEVPFII